MSVKKAVISFENGHFTVYGYDRVLISVPCAVVRKKSASAVGIAYGSDALRMRDRLAEGQAFFYAFKGDLVADASSAKLLIRHYLQLLYPYDRSIELFLIVSSGITSSGHEKTEQVFIDAGYRNIYFVERPYLLARIAENRGYSFIVDFKDYNVEVVLSEGGKPARAYSVNVGFNDIPAMVYREVCAKYEISCCITPTDRQGERSFVLTPHKEFPTLTCCSLCQADYSPVTAIGLDIISGKVKTVIFPAKDLTPIISVPYEKAHELITALLMECDEKVVTSVIEKGILYIGKATGINRFIEYMHAKTNLPAIASDDAFLEVRELFRLLSDKAFIDYSLGFHK